MANYVLYLCAAVALSWHLAVASTSRQEDGRIKRSDDPAPLEAVVEKLSQQLNTHTAQLAALTNRLNIAEKVVAFYAYDTRHPITATSSGLIVLHQIYTNVGDGFNTQTGHFTAPVSGLYQFHSNFMGADAQRYVHAAIMVDQSRVAYGISDKRHGYHDDASIEAVVHVNAGQMVYLENPDSTTSGYYGLGHTTFSGFLLRAD
ncbi:hypothetical protein BaRGS_00019616 [Batillaria attramentaria]|uniref:C1q domain-containing protein n=1 Tax=Batillaria attramentaria TaxID=370345 RepID=A0ABD0KQF3_9CAEN